MGVPGHLLDDGRDRTGSLAGRQGADRNAGMGGVGCVDDQAGTVDELDAAVLPGPERLDKFFPNLVHGEEKDKAAARFAVHAEGRGISRQQRPAAGELLYREFGSGRDLGKGFVDAIGGDGTGAGNPKQDLAFRIKAGDGDQARGMDGVILLEHGPPPVIQMNDGRVAGEVAKRTAMKGKAFLDALGRLAEEQDLLVIEADDGPLAHGPVRQEKEGGQPSDRGQYEDGADEIGSLHCLCQRWEQHVRNRGIIPAESFFPKPMTFFAAPGTGLV